MLMITIGIVIVTIELMMRRKIKSTKLGTQSQHANYDDRVDDNDDDDDNGKDDDNDCDINDDNDDGDVLLQTLEATSLTDS